MSQPAMLSRPDRPEIREILFLQGKFALSGEVRSAEYRVSYIGRLPIWMMLAATCPRARHVLVAQVKDREYLLSVGEAHDPKEFTLRDANLRIGFLMDIVDAVEERSMVAKDKLCRAFGLELTIQEMGDVSLDVRALALEGL